MSNENSDKIAVRLRQTLLKVVWRQWRTLGVLISDVHRDAQTAVDPEALLLTTTILLDEEPRLRDVLASWLTGRSTSLSIQRLRNMAKRFPPSATSLLPTLAAVALERGKDHRWRPLLGPAGTPTDLGDRKKDLLGVRTYRPSGAIIVQTRSGMGVGIKADVMAYLLCVSRSGQDWASISTIQEALGYTTAAIGRAVQEMSAANFISAPGSVDRHHRPPKMYRAESPGWGQVLGLGSGMPTWASWDQHFRFAAKFLAWNVATASRNVTDYALATNLRSLSEGHPRAIGSGRSDEEQPPSDIAEYPGFFERRLVHWENWVENNG